MYLMGKIEDYFDKQFIFITFFYLIFHRNNYFNDNY
jgi:hypothetical protein